MREFSNPGSLLSLPNLLGLQYTEPAVILSIVGIVIAAILLIQKNRADLSLMFLAWTALPLGIIIWERTSLYDNFRQILFVMPPFFIMAGLAIEKIINFIRQPILIAVFLLLTLLPGETWRATLTWHPVFT